MTLIFTAFKQDKLTTVKAMNIKTIAQIMDPEGPSPSTLRFRGPMYNLRVQQ